MYVDPILDPKDLTDPTRSGPKNQKILVKFGTDPMDQIPRSGIEQKNLTVQHKN